MMQNLISIVVPVYKAEHYLQRCIDSILQQTYLNWELLLIDDGSPDSSGEIAEKYAKIDSRIRVFHKKNGGVSSARNLGVQASRGDYLTFVDSDDCVHEAFLERMTTGVPVDLVICGFKNEDRCVFQPPSGVYETLYRQPIVVDLVDVPYYLDSPWGKLFKRDVIFQNQLKFDEKLFLSEDTIFCYEYLACCDSLRIVSDLLYEYSGVWGGDAKYQIDNSEELEFISKRGVDAIDKVATHFAVDISVKYKCFHLSKLRGLWELFTDRQVLEIYAHSHHSDISIEDFLGDTPISPLSIAIKEATNYVNCGRLDKCTEFLSRLRQFVTVPVYAIRFKSAKQKFFFHVWEKLGAHCATFVLWAVNKIRK